MKPFYSIQFYRACGSYDFCLVSLKWQMTGPAQFLKPKQHKLAFTSHIVIYTSPLAEKAATATAKSVFLFRQEP